MYLHLSSSSFLSTGDFKSVASRLELESGDVSGSLTKSFTVSRLKLELNFLFLIFSIEVSLSGTCVCTRPRENQIRKKEERELINQINESPKTDQTNHCIIFKVEFCIREIFIADQRFVTNYLWLWFKIKLFILIMMFTALVFTM